MTNFGIFRRAKHQIGDKKKKNVLWILSIKSTFYSNMDSTFNLL